MAVGRVTCTCATCGNTFEVRATRYNRRQADEWEEWAKDHYDECTECYKERMKKENAAAAKQFPLPEFEAVSEKQKNYAELQRNRYVAEHQDYMDKAIKAMKTRESEEYKKKCAEKGIDPEQHFFEYMNRFPLKDAYLCLTETNAGKFLDKLYNAY